ncbi:hypothetical protein KY290_012676 [Solanum tuberosum]|uniref:Uncharacterized protein n=1 Tax=Solanum tuberosum TaxID=4113 RepID=A0ABQ7VKB5_SOLTU|nr:hypothetical protein KY290_012676 [Solanum tuberosum]
MADRCVQATAHAGCPRPTSAERCVRSKGDGRPTSGERCVRSKGDGRPTSAERCVRSKGDAGSPRPTSADR